MSDEDQITSFRFWSKADGKKGSQHFKLKHLPSLHLFPLLCSKGHSQMVSDLMSHNFLARFSPPPPPLPVHEAQGICVESWFSALHPFLGGKEGGNQPTSMEDAKDSSQKEVYLHFCCVMLSCIGMQRAYCFVTEEQAVGRRLWHSCMCHTGTHGRCLLPASSTVSEKKRNIFFFATIFKYSFPCFEIFAMHATSRNDIFTQTHTFNIYFSFWALTGRHFAQGRHSQLYLADSSYSRIDL